MFKRIYGQSWGLGDTAANTDEAWRDVARLYYRLVEELSEVAEAVRFHHLYPTNLDNEMADFWAWWFALVSSMHRLSPGSTEELQAEDLVWNAYPGCCSACLMDRCDCRPGPVREVLSKPAVGDEDLFDVETGAQNGAAYRAALERASTETGPSRGPVTCICVIVDADRDNAEGLGVDRAGLRHVVAAIRRKLRPRDVVHRTGNAQLSLLCREMTVDEGAGAMSRVAEFLRDESNSSFGKFGQSISISVGVAECRRSSEVNLASGRAASLAVSVATSGGNRIARDSSE
jgi:GGDEF domain-containing protein/NTP pyrophosphatase (non-canonical NTP hydrolase)